MKISQIWLQTNYREKNIIFALRVGVQGVSYIKMEAKSAKAVTAKEKLLGRDMLYFVIVPVHPEHTTSW
jgi:hypothetical protein